jgi:uncharacterized protein YggE
MNMKNLTMKLFLPILWVFVVIDSSAQVKGNANYNGNSNYNYNNKRTLNNDLAEASFEDDSTIIIGANVMMNISASSYVVIIGLSQVGENAEMCNQLMNQRINGFMERLVTLGIKKNDVNIDFISQVPVYEYETEKKLFSKTYQEVPAGFYLNKNIHVAYQKSETFEQILSEAAKFEIYDFIKVEYIIDNMENSYDSLRTNAINIINKKVQSFKKLGLTFNPRFHIVAEDYASSYPPERYQKYTAFSSPSLQNVKRGSTVNQINKQETSYFEKMPYEKFDLVINPQVIAPLPQLMYSLKVKYVLKRQ